MALAPLSQVLSQRLSGGSTAAPTGSPSPSTPTSTPTSMTSGLRSLSTVLSSRLAPSSLTPARRFIQPTTQESPVRSGTASRSIVPTQQFLFDPALMTSLGRVNQGVNLASSLLRRFPATENFGGNVLGPIGSAGNVGLGISQIVNAITAPNLDTSQRALSATGGALQTAGGAINLGSTFLPTLLPAAGIAGRVLGPAGAFLGGAAGGAGATPGIGVMTDPFSAMAFGVGSLVGSFFGGENNFIPHRQQAGQELTNFAPLVFARIASAQSEPEIRAAVDEFNRRAGRARLASHGTADPMEFTNLAFHGYEADTTQASAALRQTIARQQALIQAAQAGDAGARQVLDAQRARFAPRFGEIDQLDQAGYVAGVPTSLLPYLARTILGAQGAAPTLDPEQWEDAERAGLLPLLLRVFGADPRAALPSTVLAQLTPEQRTAAGPVAPEGPPATPSLVDQFFQHLAALEARGGDTSNETLQGFLNAQTQPVSE